MQIPALPCIDLCPSPSRREARRQSRREAILEVAARSFLEKGYAGTTMSGIAADLGGSKGTLWSYFPAKDVLFAAVLDRATEAFQEQLALILKPQDDVEATLCRFARGFLQRVTSPEALALYRLVMSEASRFPETGRLFDERVIGRTRTTLATYLAGVMERSQLRSDDPQRAAQQLVALCMSGCHQALMLRVIEQISPAQMETEAAQAIAMFVRAYSA